MKKLAFLFLGAGIVSLIIGIISRVTLAPVAPIGLEAHAILQFTNTCILLSIALLLFATLKDK